MDTTERSVSPNVAAELQRLRRRAYGPDADIAGDHAAQARLSELEAAIARWTPAPSAWDNTVHDTGHDTSPDAETAALRSTPDERRPSMPAHQLEPGSPGAPAHEPPARRSRQRATTLIVAGVLLVGCAGLLAGIPRAVSGSPDETLAVRAESAEIPAADRAELGLDETLSYLALLDDRLRLHDDFRGINVWSAPTVHGTTCMVLTTRSQGVWAVGCAPPETNPQIVLNRYGRELVQRDEQDPWRGMPFGSLIRFELRGDVALVWDYPAPGPPSLFE